MRSDSIAALSAKRQTTWHVLIVNLFQFIRPRCENQRTGATSHQRACPLPPQSFKDACV